MPFNGIYPGTPISGAIDPTYYATPDDAGQYLVCEVTAHNAVGDTTQSSNLSGLIEALGTNLVAQPKAFDNADWTKGSSTTVTANAATAPDGTMTADRFEAAAEGFQGNVIVSVSQLVDLGGGTSANKTVRVSCWARSLSGTCHFALQNVQSAVAVHYSDKTATTTWQKFTYQITNSGSDGNGNQNVGLSNHSDGSAIDLYVWGYRAEIIP